MLSGRGRAPAPRVPPWEVMSTGQGHPESYPDRGRAPGTVSRRRRAEQAGGPAAESRFRVVTRRIGPRGDLGAPEPAKRAGSAPRRLGPSPRSPGDLGEAPRLGLPREQAKVAPADPRAQAPPSGASASERRRPPVPAHRLPEEPPPRPAYSPPAKPRTGVGGAAR